MEITAQRAAITNTASCFIIFQHCFSTMFPSTFLSMAFGDHLFGLLIGPSRIVPILAAKEKGLSQYFLLAILPAPANINNKTRDQYKGLLVPGGNA